MRKRMAGIIFMALCSMMTFLVPDTVCAKLIVNGAGATLPSPLYFRWIEDYQKLNPARITYRETGSSEGVRLLLARQIDMGGSDIFLSDTQMRRSPASLLHIPMCIGAVAIIYSLPGNPEIRLTPDILADIFWGRITSWRDPRIMVINRNAHLPMLAITVVHRSEGSGTTHLLTDFLSKVNPAWRQSIGAGPMIHWPVGLGVAENSGVAGLVQKIPGSIGYTSLAYAIQNHLPSALLENAQGRFIKPSVESLSAAASIDLPRDGRIFLTNSRVAQAYPICGFSYLIVYREQSYKNHSEEKARALAAFLWWCTHEGQAVAAPLHYAPIPRETIVQVEKVLRSMVYKGKPLL